LPETKAGFFCAVEERTAKRRKIIASNLMR
jgi:hypothetical protein